MQFLQTYILPFNACQETRNTNLNYIGNQLTRSLAAGITPNDVAVATSAL